MIPCTSTHRFTFGVSWCLQHPGKQFRPSSGPCCQQAAQPVSACWSQKNLGFDQLKDDVISTCRSQNWIGFVFRGGGYLGQSYELLGLQMGPLLCGEVFEISWWVNFHIPSVHGYIPLQHVNLACKCLGRCSRFTAIDGWIKTSVRVCCGLGRTTACCHAY